jgi:hypothetical protein
VRATPEQTQTWLYARMDELGIGSLEVLGELAGTPLWMGA